MKCDEPLGQHTVKVWLSWLYMYNLLSKFNESQIKLYTNEMKTIESTIWQSPLTLVSRCPCGCPRCIFQTSNINRNVSELQLWFQQSQTELKYKSTYYEESRPNTVLSWW